MGNEWQNMGRVELAEKSIYKELGLGDWREGLDLISSTQMTAYNGLQYQFHGIRSHPLPSTYTNSAQANIKPHTYVAAKHSYS